MTLPDPDRKIKSPPMPEDLSRTTARLSISHSDAKSDLAAVRELLPTPHNGAKKTSMVPASPFEDDAGFVDFDDLQGANGTAASRNMQNVAKRRRSSAHSAALVQGKVHKRKSKWTTEPVVLQYFGSGNERISMKDLQFFVLNVLKAKNACKTPSFELTAPWKLKNIVFAFVPELCKSDLESKPPGPDSKTSDADSNKNGDDEQPVESTETAEHPLAFLKTKFDHVIPTTLPESMPSLVSLLLQFPFTKAGKKRRAAEISKVKLVLNDLLMTQDQLEGNGYPVHSLLNNSADNQLEEGWVETKAFEHEGSHTFALDCEFCQTASGKALTRISIVNFQNEVVYDQLVMPDEEITDYVTRFSGITKEMLEGETTSLHDVQEKVLSLVSSGDILIGHSLNSDLNVMKIRHPRIIDTAHMFDHHRGYPFKHALKYLADIHLARSIQNGEKDGTGHSSVEDSRACLDLVKLKLIEGPDFGKILGVSLFKNAVEANPQLECSLVDYSMKEYEPILYDTKEPTLSKCTVSCDEEVVDVSIENLASKSFHLLWLRELQYNCGKKSVPSNYTGHLVDEANRNGGRKSPVSTEDRANLLQKLDQRIERLYKELPSDSLLIINTGGGDPTRMNYLNYVKRSFQRQLKAGKEITEFTPEELWDFTKATELSEATESARQGMTLLAVKQ